MGNMQVAVVIPVYNEEENLPTLFQRLQQALDKLNKSYEIIFVDDGSRDKSAALLSDFYTKHPEHVRVILFNRNFGQHMAIMAAFEKAFYDNPDNGLTLSCLQACGLL